VSNAHPNTTFFDLLGAQHLEIEFANRIRRIRSKGLVAKLHLALSGAPRFTGLDEARGRLILAPNLEAIEQAYDHAKYGQLPERPVVEAVVPSLYEPRLAPPGRHGLSAHAMYVPRRLRGGWTEAAKATLRERLIDMLAAQAPGLRALVIGAEVLTPEDIENSYRVAGGHWHHGDFALDQMAMMRPTYGTAQYQAPVAGLWLCGAGCHPAGDLTGAPGYNAARAILAVAA